MSVNVAKAALETSPALRFHVKLSRTLPKGQGFDMLFATIRGSGLVRVSPLD